MLAPSFASQVERVSDDFHQSLGGGEEEKGTPFHRAEESAILTESLPFASNSSSFPTSISASILNIKGERQCSRTRENTALGPLTPLLAYLWTPAAAPSQHQCSPGFTPGLVSQ